MRRSFLSLAAALLSSGSALAAGSAVFEIGNTVPQACTVTYYCGAPDRCLAVNLSNYTTDQTTASITANCNFAGSGATLTYSSANGGKLTHAGDPGGIVYQVAHSGGSGLSFPLQSFAAPIANASYVSPSANTDQTGSLKVRLADPGHPLVAGDYRDTITVSVTP